MEETLYGAFATIGDKAVDTPKCTREVPATLNIYWVLGTCLCVWFLWIHAPIVLLAKDYIPPLLYVHLFGVYAVYMACVHNTLLTPSTFGGAARPFHIVVGRFGLILGVVGFVSGFILTWLTKESYPLGFSIGITSGGIGQMMAQYTGYKAIRKFKEIKAQLEASSQEDIDQDERFRLEDEQDKQLIIHISQMFILFFLACGIPALMRMADSLGTLSLVLFIILFCFLAFSVSKVFEDKILSKRRAERDQVRSN